MPTLDEMYPWFEWLGQTPPAQMLSESIWLFPVIQCMHLLALALLGGTVLVVDLRMLGLGLRNTPVPELARKVQPWLVGAIAGMLATGSLLFLAETIKCLYSPPFWWKMGFLLSAIVFTFAVRRPVALHATVHPLLRGAVGIVSLGLWLGTGFYGRWIAFY